MKRFFLRILPALLCAGCLASADKAAPPAPDQNDDRIILAEQTAAIVSVLERSGSFVNDAATDRLIATIVARLPLPPEQGNPRVRLVRNPALNAFALYDGTIGIHVGAFAKTTHPDHLAFLIAHETAHWSSLHAVQSFSRASDSILATQIVDVILTPLSSRFSLEDVAEEGIGWAANATVNSLSRELEREADAAALQMLYAGGFDTRRSLDIIRIFQGIDAQSPLHSGSLLLSTHPSSSDRTETMVLFLHERSLEPFESLSFDAAFVRETAQLRLLDARLQRLGGRYFEALDDLSIVQRAFDGSRAKLPASFQCERGLTYASMLRDFPQTKASVPADYWKTLYSERSDSEVQQLWGQRAKEGLSSKEAATGCAAAAERALADLEKPAAAATDTVGKKE